MATRWRDAAISDLERIDTWLSSIEGADPDKVRERIGLAIATLERLGDIGRPGRRKGTREISVRNAPYVVVYRMIRRDIDILAVYHAAQNR